VRKHLNLIVQVRDLVGRRPFDRTVARRAGAISGSLVRIHDRDLHTEFVVDNDFDPILVTLDPPLAAENLAHTGNCVRPSMKPGRRLGVISGAAATRGDRCLYDFNPLTFVRPKSAAQLAFNFAGVVIDDRGHSIRSRYFFRSRS
jgi:hypothetical protein